MKIIIADANVSKLLAQTDEVLKKYGKHDVPEKIKGQATLSALKQFMSNGHFSVCKINDLAKMNDVVFDTEHKDLFSTLHCVDWSDIHPDTKEYVTALLLNYFRGNIVMTYAEGA